MNPPPQKPLRCGYTDTPHGQLHWRAIDAAATNIVLLHWAPGSGRMYEPVIGALSALGVNGLAFDLPGFGCSMRTTGVMSAKEMACCLAAGLSGLTEQRVTIVGGHLSAEVALEWAIQAPQQVSAVVLDGVYALNEDEFLPLLEPYRGLSPRFIADGAHETFLWQATCAVLKEWDPHFVASPGSMDAIYTTMSDYLLMGYPAILSWMEGEKPAPGLDILERIRVVACPMLILTAEADPLRCAFARTISACQAPPRVHEFPGVHPLLSAGAASIYAEVLARFLATMGSRASSP